MPRENSVLGGNFGDNLKESVAGVRRACKEAKQPGGKRTIERDPGRVLSQEPGGYVNHVVKASCGLEDNGSRDQGDCYQHDVEGNVSRSQFLDKLRIRHRPYHTLQVLWIPPSRRLKSLRELWPVEATELTLTCGFSVKCSSPFVCIRQTYHLKSILDIHHKKIITTRA